MKKNIKERIAKLQAVLKEKDLDAALIYDRENLIYFAGVDDLEGGVLCIPVTGEPELFCLAWDGVHMKETSGIDKVTPYPFPQESHSLKAAQWLKKQGYEHPKVGFTRYFISLKDYQLLLATVPDFTVGDIAVECYKLRSIKCQEELDLMQKVAGFLDKGMEAAVQFVHPGVTETEVLAEAEYAMAKAGSQGSPFRMQVLCHERQMLMHPYASSARIKDNEPVVIHLGASLNGYVAKMCRTIFLGNAPQTCLDIYACLRQAQKVAMESIKPGVTCGQVFDVTTAYVASTPFAPYWKLDHIGYGVGIRQSEFYPIIAKGSNVILKENMVVDLLLPTLYKPGMGGPRITDTIKITAQGAQFMTSYNRENIIKK